MIKERRRQSRMSTKLAIKLILQNQTEETLLAGPVAGSLTDISLLGCQIQLDHIYIDNHHLFYSSEEDTNTLYLEINPDEDEKFLLPILPVWFDRISVEGSETSSFKMGVEFVAGSENVLTDRLKKLIKEIEMKETGWFNKFFFTFKNEIVNLIH